MVCIIYLFSNLIFLLLAVLESMSYKPNIKLEDIAGMKKVI